MPDADKLEAAADLRKRAAHYLERRQVARADLCEMTAERLEKESNHECQSDGTS